MNDTVPRDFLEDADGWLRFPRPLKQLLAENRSEVLFNLEKSLENGSTYQKKYAAFVFGQLGEQKALELLERCSARETVRGVKEAMGAAITALRYAPIENGFTEIQRRKIIEDKYNGVPLLSILEDLKGITQAQPKSKSSCFIATAVYGSGTAPEVLTLRKFRDEILLPSKVGRTLVNLYYFLSPPVARFLSANRFLRNVVRKAVVRPIVNLVRLKQ